MNPDPYVECDPEVDIDKAQAEEDANYFDEEDLGNRIIWLLQALYIWHQKLFRVFFNCSSPKSSKFQITLNPIKIVLSVRNS